MKMPFELRAFTLENISSSFTNEDRDRLDQLYKKVFRTKKRVSALMSKDKVDIEILINEIVEKFTNLGKELGMCSDSGE